MPHFCLIKKWPAKQNVVQSCWLVFVSSKYVDKNIASYAEKLSCIAKWGNGVLENIP